MSLTIRDSEPTHRAGNPMLSITTHTQAWDKLLPGWDQGSGLAWGFQVCLFVPLRQWLKAPTCYITQRQEPWRPTPIVSFPETTAPAHGDTAESSTQPCDLGSGLSKDVSVSFPRFQFLLALLPGKLDHLLGSLALNSDPNMTWEKPWPRLSGHSNFLNWVLSLMSSGTL